MYPFENKEYAFKAYWVDFPFAGCKFKFSDNEFFIEIPELDYGEFEKGNSINKIIKDDYSIEIIDNFNYVKLENKKYLVLYYKDIISILIDCENNDAFFGLNVDSQYVVLDKPGQRNKVGIRGDSEMVQNIFSSFLVENINGVDISYIRRGQYYYQLTSPWVEGVPGYGIGEWLQEKIYFDTNEIVFFNGYIDPNRPDLYYKNSRIKEIEVISGSNSWTFKIEDKPDPQVLELPIEITGTIKYVIKDVYPGTKYEDTCLAGIYYLHDFTKSLSKTQ
ncbi:MAG: hypothetical protein PQJ46_02345 [Spirochaetales bacterium]|nr:hypothetical protein [Spirochaetales bacterium]